MNRGGRLAIDGDAVSFSAPLSVDEVGAAGRLTGTTNFGAPPDDLVADAGASQFVLCGRTNRGGPGMLRDEPRFLAVGT